MKKIIQILIDPNDGILYGLSSNGILYRIRDNAWQELIRSCDTK